MILTITPNPALDVSGIVSELVPDEKSYVSQELRFPGGNGVNAARIAHRLGAKVLATGFLGGSSGKEFSQLLAQEKIPNHFIEIRGRTRTNFTISLEASHEQTRLSFPGPKILTTERSALLEFLEDKHASLVIVGGSLPDGISLAFIKKIISVCKKKNIPVFVDVPGKTLKHILSSKPVFIKPNLTEFQEMTGKKLTKKDDVVAEARKLSASIPIQCISSVEGGAVLVTRDHAWFGKIPKIKVHSTVGAGDSMVGAMAYSFVRQGLVLNETTCERMFRFGLAAACATLSSKGLTMGSRTKIRAYYSEIIIKKFY